MEKPCWLPWRVVFLETGSTLASCDPRWWKPNDILLHTVGIFSYNLWIRVWGEEIQSRPHVYLRIMILSKTVLGNKSVFCEQPPVAPHEVIMLKQLLVRTSGISSWPCFSTVCFTPSVDSLICCLINTGSPWIMKTDRWKVTEGSWF